MIFGLALGALIAVNYIKSKATKVIVVFLMVIGVLVIAACNSSSRIEELQSENQEETAGVIVALPEATATIPVVETPSATLEPTVEPTVAPTVEPTATVEATSVTFSEKYPVKWNESYTANVGGMEIPIDIGLTHWIMNRPDEPISEIHIAADMVDNVGEYFMQMCFWRYTQLMDHPEITYEQYLELVAKGEGKIEVATYDEDKPDQKIPEVTLIDPRKGFSFAWVDGDLPLKIFQFSFRLGSSKEKILFSQYIPSSRLNSPKKWNRSEEDYSILLLSDSITSHTLSILGNCDNQKIIHENNEKAGCKTTPAFIDHFNNLLIFLMDKPFLDFKNGIRSEPPFSIEQ